MLHAPIYFAEVFESRQPWALGNAVKYLIGTLASTKPKSMTIARLEPQTNLALALIQHPEIAQGIREVVMMSGAHLNCGNITTIARFNVCADPHVSDMVFKSSVPITVIPLDVTHKMLPSSERIACLRKIDNQAGKIAADIIDMYVEHDIISSMDCLAVRYTM